MKIKIKRLVMDNRAVQFGLFIGGVILAAVLVWWLFFYHPYRPKAYVGIARWDVEEPVRLNHRSYIVEVDLPTATVTDTFPVSETVTRVHALAVDQQRGLLYVGGEDPGDPGEESQCRGVDVYDLRTKEKIRTINISGPRKITHLRLSGNGKRILARNPYFKKKSGEEGKSSGLYEIKTGEFLSGFRRAPAPWYYISGKGEYLYNIFGLHKSASIIGYSISNDEKVVDIKYDKQKVLKRGGLHPDPENGFKLEYPYYVWINDWKPMEVYDRETMEQIDTGPVVMKGLEEDQVYDEYSTDATMLSKNHRYLVVRFYKGQGRTEGDPKQLFIRVVDLKKMEIVGTTKAGEGYDQWDHSNVVAY